MQDFKKSYGSIAKRWPVLLTGAVAAVLLPGCGGGSSDPTTVTSIGPEVTIGNGSGHSYVVSKGQVPMAIGVQITAGALTGTPPGPPPLNTDSFHMPLPVQAKLTTFKDLTFYYTQGHQPTPQYGAPHYHAAFSLISAEERAKIAFLDFSGDTPVNPLDVAPTFVDFGFVLPALGTVYYDPMTPEFNGGPFTTEFDYGFFNSKNTTWNLTANRTVLVNKQNAIDQPLALPTRYRFAGYYPTKYTIKYDAASNTYKFEFSGMVMRTNVAP